MKKDFKQILNNEIKKNVVEKKENISLNEKIISTNNGQYFISTIERFEKRNVEGEKLQNIQFLKSRNKKI